MLKRCLAIGGLVVISVGANAGMVERDWVTAGDRCLTFVSELNIEILDASFTANISHTDAANELSAGGLYAGFRFINGSEIRAIIDSYFGGMNSQFQLLPSGSEASTQMFTFLDLIDANTTPYGRNLTFSSCEYALGCELGILVGGQYHLRDSQRWNFTAESIAMVDQLESSSQLLIRDAVTVASVPEPKSLLLFALGLMLVGVRYRFIK